MKMIEIKKYRYRRELFFCGRRVCTFLRMGNIFETILRDLGWIIGHYEMKQHGIEVPADCHNCWSEHKELVEIRLGDLRRVWVNGSQSLSETVFVHYLKTGNRAGVRSYYEEVARIGALSQDGVRQLVEDSCRLFDGLKEVDYDPSISCIVVNCRNEIIDGYHRASMLLARHGEDFRVKVLRLLPDER